MKTLAVADLLVFGGNNAAPISQNKRSGQWSKSSDLH